MALFAAVDNATVVAWRDIADYNALPAYKREALDERGDGGPSLRPVVEEGSGPLLQIIVETNRVRRVYSTPAPTIDDVARERDRRMALGFHYDFGDGRGVHHIATTEADMKGWDEVSKLAQAAINLGAPATTITIVTATGPAVVTAMEWQQILVAAGAARQPLWAASFALQAMDPIPTDYTDDAYWVS